MTGYPSRTLLFDWVCSLNFVQIPNVLTGLYCMTRYCIISYLDWNCMDRHYCWTWFCDWISFEYIVVLLNILPESFCIASFNSCTGLYAIFNVLGCTNCITVWLNFFPRLCCGVFKMLWFHEEWMECWTWQATGTSCYFMAQLWDAPYSWAVSS